MNYYRMTEANENEGEVWIFYFKADSETYNLILDATDYVDDILEVEGPFSKEIVDIVVEHTSDLADGYFPPVSERELSKKKLGILKGIMDELDEQDADEADEYNEELIELFYKGGLFK